ncbi:hypothetical protein cco113_08077, partial [Campylobacter coli 2688]
YFKCIKKEFLFRIFLVLIKNIDKNYYFNIKMVKDITRRD